MAHALVGLAKADHVPETPGEYTEQSLAVVEALVARAVAAVTDLAALVGGKTVLVKPNLVRPNPANPYAVVTDERVLFAVVKLLREAGARAVWVGDNPGYGLSLEAAMRQMGDFKDRLHQRGGELVFFDNEPKVSTHIPEATLFDTVELPQRLMEADVYINLPKMKTHMHTLVTLGIKNQYGLVLDAQRMFFHRNDINIKIVDILKAVRPHLTILDGVYAVQGQAPISGSVVEDMNVILASDDVVALDTVGAHCMGIDAMEVAILRLARREGLGCAVLDDIEIRGDALETAVRRFKRPVISSMGAYDAVDAIEGGACFGCLSALRHALDKLDSENRFAGREPSTVYVGKPMPNRVSCKRPEQGDFWCFGTCAADMVYNNCGCQQTPARFIPGCPPHILDFYKAYIDAEPDAEADAKDDPPTQQAERNSPGEGE